MSLEFTHTVYVESREMCLEIECLLEYEGETGDGWHEPRYPESASLISAKLGKVDITEALTDDQIAAIESDALVDHGERMKEADAERKWEARVGAYD